MALTFKFVGNFDIGPAWGSLIQVAQSVVELTEIALSQARIDH